MGMELILRDTFSQLASLPAYRGRIFDVLVPEVKSVRSLGKSLRLIQKPQYPGYVFVQMMMSRELYDVILSPNGVASFVGRRVSATISHSLTHSQHLSLCISRLYPISPSWLTQAALHHQLTPALDRPTT